MGSKYNISDDGTIFEIKEDGSISRIAKVGGDGDIHKFGSKESKIKFVQKKKTKLQYFASKHKIKIGITCVILGLLAFVIPTVYNDHLAADIMKNMVYVQGGTFQMGNNDYNDSPVHSVTLSSYYIGKYEVSQQSWQEIMGSNPSSSNGLNKPVTNVAWHDCVKFCNALSRKTGLEECYEICGNDVRLNIYCNGYRLPTEAEWEFAARGGIKSQDYKYSGSSDLDEVAWYKDNSGGHTHSIGFLQSNELGIYDMSGNVSEWCWDWYETYSSNPQGNPTGAMSGLERVFRGGSFDCLVKMECLPSRRSKYFPVFSQSSASIGFRLVRRP